MEQTRKDKLKETLLKTPRGNAFRDVIEKKLSNLDKNVKK